MAELGAARRFPLLFQLNARTAVHAIDPAGTLDVLDDARLDGLLPQGTDWLYLLGVWQTGAASRAVSLLDPGIRQACEEALPDLTDDDICGSCFAVTGYQVHEALGGDGALARLRARLAARGVRLMLDFVPNHVALDHPWVQAHPEYFVEGSDDDLAAAPANWIRMEAGGAERVLAYGRDPFFAGWSDTLQLDYSQPALQAAMADALLTAASHGDGLRCDMAMLLLPDVFERTWGRAVPEFWPDALDAARQRDPEFTAMAEVYWDREFDLQERGFDLTYDKRLYDRLLGDLPGVRPHLCAEAGYQARSARFLENHDESRAATTFGTGARHRAAAVTTYLATGLRFVQHGQREAHRVHVPVHLCRAPVEPDNGALADFYDRLLDLLDRPLLHDGTWRLLDVRRAWDGNGSSDRLVASSWSDAEGVGLIVVANLADTASQGYLHLPHPELAGRSWALDDALGTERYERDGDRLATEGLFVDVAGWGCNAFVVEPAS